MKTVSIGLPVVKDQFVEAALKGALAQQHREIELIVLNNAADRAIKSRIAGIVQQFDDTRIRYLENETQVPMIPNWNKTLSYATGEFFCLLSDDDRWAPEYLTEMLSLAEQFPSTNIFHCRMVTIDEQDREIDLAPLAPAWQDHLDFIYHRIKGFSKFTLSDFMLRTEALRDIGGFVNMLDGWGSDDITWFKMAKKGGIAYSEKPYYYYRENSFNVSNAKGIRNKYRSISDYVSHVRNIVRTPEADAESYEVFKHDLVLKQLEIYRRKNCTYLVDKGLREHNLVPEALVPFIMPFLKGYKRVFGW